MTETITEILLDETSLAERRQEVEHEKEAAIASILEENSFTLIGEHNGPYRLHLGVADNRLRVEVYKNIETTPAIITVPVSPFRRIIKDYFLICDSYFEAVRTADPMKVEAIDMGRRGVHNEGSELLCELLRDKVKMDFETARRLFTLIYVLHLR